MQRLLLVHDVLDLQLCNLQGDKIGRADSILLELRLDQPPRVATILVGGPVRQERVGRVSVWIGKLLRRISRSGSEGQSEIPFSAVRKIGDTLVVDVTEESLPSEHVERWLCERIVRHIPGAEGERK